MSLFFKTRVNTWELDFSYDHLQQSLWEESRPTQRAA
jgi:hypothetical protein